MIDIIIGALVGLLCGMLLLFLIGIPHLEITQECKEKFPPSNSTDTEEKYKHCIKYPDTYGVKK